MKLPELLGETLVREIKGRLCSALKKRYHNEK